MGEDDKMDPEVFRRVGFTRIVTSGYLLWEYVPDENRHYLAGIIDLADGFREGSDPEGEADMFYETGKLYRPVIQLPHEHPDIE